MVSCCVPACKSRSSRNGIRFFNIPRNEERRKVWVNNINRPGWTPKPGQKLCELHFTPDQYENNRSDGRRLLKWNAVPTVFHLNGSSSKETFIEKHPDFRTAASTLEGRTSLPADVGLYKESAQQEPVPVRESVVVSSYGVKFWQSLDAVHSLGLKEYAKLVSSDAEHYTLKDLVSHLSAKFQPGVLEDSIFLFSHKMKPSAELPLYCTVSLDAYTVQAAMQYDLTNESFIGCVAPLSTDQKLASQVVALVAKGIDIEWKCIVGYVFIRSQEDLWIVWQVLKNAIAFMWKYHFYVINISLNRFPGFQILREIHKSVLDVSEIKATVPHPADGSKILSFTQNVENLVQDMCDVLVHQNILLPELIQKKFKLGKHPVSKEHLSLDHERISSETLSEWLFDCGAKRPCDTKGIEIHNTVWFLDIMKKWTQIMSSSRKLTIFANSCPSPDIQVLKTVSVICESLAIDADSENLKKLWCNIQLTTVSVIFLYNTYVVSDALSYLQPSLLKPTSLYNVSTSVNWVDLKSLSPLKAKQFLHLVNVALLLTPTSSEPDAECIDVLNQILRENESLDTDDYCNVSNVEDLGLYYLSGRIVSQYLLGNACVRCREFLVANQTDTSKPIEWINAIEDRGLVHPSSLVYDIFQWAESCFINSGPNLKKVEKVQSRLASKVFDDLALDICCTFPSCHDSLFQLLFLFMGVRLQMLAEDVTQELA